MAKRTIMVEKTPFSFEEYAALWGSDASFDKPPRLPGDGAMFYNFGVEGNDPAFLNKFIHAINRTIQSVQQTSGNAVDISRDCHQLIRLQKECIHRLQTIRPRR